MVLEAVFALDEVRGGQGRSLISVPQLCASLFLSRYSPKVMGPFAAATTAAAGTAVYLNQVVAKVTVFSTHIQSYLFIQSDL